MKLFIKKTLYGFSHRIKNNYQGKETVAYLDVQFPSGQEPESEVLQIDVKDSFFSCYESSTGVKIKLVVKDYEIIQTFDKSQSDEATVENADADSTFDFSDIEGVQIEINDDAFPFD